MSRKHGFFRPHLGRGFPQVASTTMREGGGARAIEAFFADGTDGWYHRYNDASKLFQDNLGATPYTAADQAIGRANDLSGRGRFSFQATGTAKGSGQLVAPSSAPVSNVLRVATDDFYSVGMLPPVTGMMMCRAKLTGGGAAVRYALGSFGGANDRCYLYFTAAGAVACRLGNGAEITVGGDVTNTIVTLGMRWNGITVDLLLNGAVAASAAQVGLPSVTHNVVIGANNAGGIPASFLTGDIYADMLAAKYPTEAQVLAFHNEVSAL